MSSTSYGSKCWSAVISLAPSNSCLSNQQPVERVRVVRGRLCNLQRVAVVHRQTLHPVENHAARNTIRGFGQLEPSDRPFDGYLPGTRRQTAATYFRGRWQQEGRVPAVQAKFAAITRHGCRAVSSRLESFDHLVREWGVEVVGNNKPASISSELALARCSGRYQSGDHPAAVSDIDLFAHCGAPEQFGEVRLCLMYSDVHDRHYGLSPSLSPVANPASMRSPSGPRAAVLRCFRRSPAPG